VNFSHPEISKLSTFIPRIQKSLIIKVCTIPVKEWLTILRIISFSCCYLFLFSVLFRFRFLLFIFFSYSFEYVVYLVVNLPCVQDQQVHLPFQLKSTVCNFDPPLSSMSPYDLPVNHPDKFINCGQPPSKYVRLQAKTKPKLKTTQLFSIPQIFSYSLYLPCPLPELWTYCPNQGIDVRLECCRYC